jgi:hypothetical protein
MKFLSIDHLTAIRFHLKHLDTKPDLVLVCAEYEYQYILHHFKEWPCPMIRVNMFEPDAETTLKEEITKLTGNSLVISTEETYNLIVNALKGRRSPSSSPRHNHC